jgi:hypothetical protein
MMYLMAIKSSYSKGLTVDMNIPSSDVQLLASIAGVLKNEYIREGAADPWSGSPFAWIRTLPSRQVGKIGEQLVAGWCAAKGLDVVASRDSQAGRVISGHRVEVKFSTLWASGVYKFQQLRDQNYEYAICLGLSPFGAHCWVIPKDVLKMYVIGHTPQHTGRGGTDTFWLSFPISNPPVWLSAYGGSLEMAFQILSSFGQV